MKKRKVYNGYIPSKEYGYQPKDEQQRGYKPLSATKSKVNIPPKGGSSVQPPKEDYK